MMKRIAQTLLVPVLLSCLVGVGAVLLSACRAPLPSDPLVETVAILLFDNESNALDADDVLQQMTFDALRQSPYDVLDIKETNEKLNQAGIIDGGQLPIIDPTKLGKDLGVQALLYGSVESFNFINVGFYRERKVRLALKLVEVATGEVLWQNTGTGATRLLAFDKDDAQAAFAEGLAEKALEKAFHIALEPEAEMAVVRTLWTLPGFQFAGFDRSGSVSKGVGRRARDMFHRRSFRTEKIKES